MERRAAKLSTENDEVEETRINIANVLDRGEAIELISRYEEIMTHNKKVNRYVAKQFKDSENLFENVG